MWDLTLKRLHAGATSSLDRSLLLEEMADYRCAMADEVMAKENAMTTPVDTVREFYAAIAAGDTGKMVGLMAPDIEWISVVDFNVQDKAPRRL